MADRGSLYYDGAVATVAIPDGRGGVVEFRTAPSRGKAAVSWFRVDGAGPLTEPFAGVVWSPSQDPHLVAVDLARCCGVAMCRNEANYARAKSRLAAAV